MWRNHLSHRREFKSTWNILRGHPKYKIKSCVSERVNDVLNKTTKVEKIKVGGWGWEVI